MRNILRNWQCRMSVIRIRLTQTIGFLQRRNRGAIDDALCQTMILNDSKTILLAKKAIRVGNHFSYNIFVDVINELN